MGRGAHLGARYSEEGRHRDLLAHLQPEDVHEVRFGRAGYREGYVLKEVDHFLELIERQLRGGHGRPARPLTADDVMAVKFSTTRFRTGYDQDDVDDFLDLIATELRRLALM
jgi:DivIVA domain-containing protein